MNIENFVKQMAENITRRLTANFGIRLTDGDITEQLDRAWQNPLATPIGHRLQQIAAAATGELPDDQRPDILDHIQALLETLFAMPGEARAEPPSWFWETELGGMVSAGMVWANNDQLITQAAAAEVVGVSVAAINNAIRDGRLTGYRQGDASAHRPGGVLVSRAEVAQLK